jgi:tripartite-type tricarboxylate transporter receptor subunit TctC
LGVPFGAYIACQIDTLKPFRPASSSVGNFDSAGVVRRLVDVMCDQTTNTTSQIESGKIKAYAVTSKQRLKVPASLAKLPTLDESGLKGFNVTIWHALYAPKGTPKAALDKVNAALKEALKDADFVKREESLGAVIITDARVNPGEHKKFVESEINKWGPVIKAAGQYAD